jgi:hypothetical protein
MKNTKILFTVLAVALVFGMTVLGCGGAPNEPPIAPTSAIYESRDNKGNIYILAITKSGFARAAYIPGNGDSYVLTIILTSGDVKKSNGTVENTGSSLKLKPDNSNVTFTVTITNENMKEIKEPIILNDGSSLSAPEGALTSTGYKTNSIKLYANDWSDKESGESGQNWFSTGDFKYKDFTVVMPKVGWKLKFLVRGTTDKPLKWFTIGLNSFKNNDYKWYGGYDIPKPPKTPVTLSKSFEKTFEIIIWREPSNDVYDDMFLEFSNVLWGKEANGSYRFNSGTVLDKPNGTLMATISNLEVRLMLVD